MNVTTAKINAAASSAKPAPAPKAEERPRFVTVTDEAPEAIAAAAAQIAQPAVAAQIAPARPALNAKTRAEQAAGRKALSAYSDAPLEE